MRYFYRKTEIEAIVGDIDSPDYTAQVYIIFSRGCKICNKKFNVYTRYS